MPDGTARVARTSPQAFAASRQLQLSTSPAAPSPRTTPPLHAKPRRGEGPAGLSPQRAGIKVRLLPPPPGAASLSAGNAGSWPAAKRTATQVLHFHGSNSTRRKSGVPDMMSEYTQEDQSPCMALPAVRSPDSRTLSTLPLFSPLDLSSELLNPSHHPLPG